MTSLQTTLSVGALDRRAADRERLKTGRFDLLVVGGGIVGAGVASLATEHGLAVALLDRGDFASGTSSASSKLIHGGLRYLRMGDFRLVREALHESNALVASVAPHLVRRLRFLLPIYEGGPYGRAAIRSALLLYRALAGGEARSTLLPGDIAASLVPSLRVEHLRSAGVYSDAQTNDARLCLANLHAASERGAVVMNYAEVVGIDASKGPRPARVAIVDRLGGQPLEIDARAVVNAAGPWVDRVRRLEDPSASSSVTLSKGAHLTVDLPDGWQAALTIPLDRTRVSFAVPWEGTLLLGTTDEPYDGHPDDVNVTEDDERQILDEAGTAIEADVLRPPRVRGRFAGLRVLPATGCSTAKSRRETSIMRGPTGMITVAGGKLTTYRRIAASALDALRPELALHGATVPLRSLPGAIDPDVQARKLLRDHADLEPSLATVLAASYGTLSSEVLALAADDKSLLEPLVPGAPEIAAQVVHAQEREWAMTRDDVLRRRTTLELRGFRSDELHARVDELLTRTSLHGRPR